MMGKKPVIGVLLAVAAAYCVDPYVTLCRLGRAGGGDVMQVTAAS